MITDKYKFALWLNPETLEQVRGWYQADGCRSQSEFIEKAVRFYCGYLAAGLTGDYLPRVLSSLWEGQLGLFADRLAKLLYKLAVEEAILSHLIAADSELDEEGLDKLRGRCVRDVNRTNGQLSFKEILRFQKEL